MRAAALPRGWHAPQPRAAAPAPAIRALPVCAACPRSAQLDARFHSAVAGRTRKARVATALQPAPRGEALVANAGEAGEAEARQVFRGAFFNRGEELKSLSECLAEEPASVLVMTGPPSCGKSALLKQLVAGVKQPPRPTVVNCRAGDYMNPEAFSENLVTCMQNDWQLGADSLLALFPAVIKLAGKVSGVDMTTEFLKAELQKKPQTALRTITDAYLKLVKDAKKKRKEGDPWPVIIIDEANALMEWKDAETLSALLKFFVYLTKEEQLAHVILATSDTFLTQWLDSGPIKGPFRSSCVLGNLSREEACTYFFDYVLPFRKHPPGATEAWERVYDVCGGNPGLLQLCASRAAALRSWELACNAIVQTAMTDISNGLRLTSWKDAAWRTEDFRAVLQTIVSSPHAAVLVLQMDAELGEGGAAKLESMNAKNLLLRRAYDPLARDIDAAAFGPKLKDVYTLPSAAHVLAARIELDLE